MPLYVQYGRTSGDKQKKDETIQSQIDAGRRWAEHTGARITKHYLDDGITSRIPIDERPAGTLLMRDARAGKFTHILIYNYRRLGRTQLDTLQILDELARLNIEVVSIMEPMPETGASSVIDLMRGMLTSFGQYDRATLLQGLYDGKVRAAGQSRYLGGPIPFGYRIENRRFVLVESHAAQVRSVFEAMLSGGYSLRSLAMSLNARGVNTPKGWKDGRTDYRWNAGAVWYLLRNPIYMGRFVWRRTRSARGDGEREVVSETEVPAIVTQAEFEAVQEILNYNSKFAGRNARHVYLLRSLVRCAVCGLTMCGFKRGQAKDRAPAPPKYYYRCHSVYAKRGYCGNLLVPADALEETVWQWCVSQINAPGAAVENLRAQLIAEEEQDAAAHTSLPARIKETERLIEEKSKARVRLIRMLAEETATVSEYESVLKELRSEVEVLEQERDKLERQAARGAQAESRLHETHQLLKRLRRKIKDPDTSTRRRIIESLVSQVRIKHNLPGGTPAIAIHFRS